MDKKIGVLAAISIVASVTSGCTSFRGSSQGAYGSDDYGYGSSQSARSSQVSRNDQIGNGTGSNRWFGQQYQPPATCKPCTSAPKPQVKTQTQNTYTYRPTPKPKTVQKGEHSQQWYIDRWNRQQQQQQKPKPRATDTSTYSGYGSGGYDSASKGSSSTYYDYSSAGAGNSSSAATSNKSIYTGSYQQKTYKPYNPKTYAGGSAGSTVTSTTTYSGSSSGGGNTYIVKKGDTVFEIMRQTGVYWKDIISLNNLQPPYNIVPGQTIRLK